ncbi:DUF3465 domain-containing protein [Hydrogenimonas sp.]
MKLRKTSIFGALLATFVAILYPQLQRLSLPSISTVTSDVSKIENAQARRLTNVWVTGRGRVVKILPDDNEGHRHQRFILRLENGRTLLVVHNIDLAPPLPGLEKGDLVEFRGEFVYNPKGGLIHWTHHDPSGRKKGGWLRYKGKLYR